MKMLLVILMAFRAFSTTNAPRCYGHDGGHCRCCDQGFQIHDGICTPNCPSHCTKQCYNSCLGGCNARCDCGSDTTVFDIDSNGPPPGGFAPIGYFEYEQKKGYYFDGSGKLDCTSCNYWYGLTHVLTFWVRLESCTGNFVDHENWLTVDCSSNKWIYKIKLVDSSNDSGTTAEQQVEVTQDLDTWKKIAFKTIRQRGRDSNGDPCEENCGDGSGICREDCADTYSCKVSCTNIYTPCTGTCSDYNIVKIRAYKDDVQQGSTQEFVERWSRDGSSGDWVIGNTFTGFLRRLVLKNDDLEISTTYELSDCTLGEICGTCDYLCTGCQTDPWECQDDASCDGEIRLNSICMRYCPTGFGSCSSVTGVILEETFTSFSPTNFQAGADASTYFPFNSGETDDPLPMKERGMYLDSNRFLESSSNFDFHYDFTISLWFRVETNGILLERGTYLSLDTGTGLTLKLEDHNVYETDKILGFTFTTEEWHYVLFTCEFSSASGTTLKRYIDNAVEQETESDAERIFRSQAQGKIKLGGSSASGFIYKIKILQEVDTTTSGDDICSDSFVGACLWNCNHNQYWDGSNCQNCDATCSMGCVREDDCNLCNDELCAECSGLGSNRCTVCKTNANKNPDGECKCIAGYFADENQECSTCTSANCDSCTGGNINDCEACSTDYYLVQGMCIDFCPTSFTDNSGVCTSTLPDVLVFHLNLGGVISDTPEDQASSIPVNTGKDNRFYPDYDLTDPIAAGARGYYFNGVSSYMKVDSELIIPPEFTLVFWMMLNSNSGVLFSKESILNSVNDYIKVYLDAGEPKVAIELTSGNVQHGAGSVVLGQWEFLVVRSYLESSEYKISVSLNDGSPTVHNAGGNIYQDFTSDYVFTIGAEYVSASSIGAYFHGFLYEFRIYNSNHDPSSLLQSSGCSGFGGCTYCPSDNSGQCLPICKINEYWDEENNSCETCHENCQETGCVRNDSFCNLCSDQKCKACEDVSTCDVCIKNASGPPDCECDSKYYWNSSAEVCDLCTGNCDSCTNSAFNNCTQCSTNYYLVSKVCLPFCPSGYSPKNGVCELSNDLLLHFQPHSIEDTVTDSASSIPFSSGSDASFYPQPSQGDPYPTQGRGYLFTGDSYMHYECGEDCSSEFLVSSEFTLTSWFKSTSTSGTIFSKQKSTPPYTKSISVGIDSDYVKVYLDIPGYDAPQSKCSVNRDWNFLAVSASVGSEPKVTIQVNNTCTDSISLGEEWLEDFQNNYHLVIGAALEGTSTFSEFFSGFLWDLKLYNAQKDPNTLVQSSNCKTCDHCPVDNSDECLSICPVEHFWNGYICENCNSEKDRGCVDPDTTFQANLTTQTNNLLNLSFSEELKTSLKKQDFELLLENNTASYTLEEFSLAEYKIEIAFNSHVEGGEVVQILFNTDILSSLNHTLAKNEIKSQLYEAKSTQETPIYSKEAESSGQQVAGGSLLGGASISLITSNPSGLWIMLNTIQLLSYLSISNNPLTPTLRGFFKGLNLTVGIPSLFNLVIESSQSPNTDKYSNDYGFKSKLFLINAGLTITIFCSLLVAWPFIWLLSKCKASWVEKACKFLLKKYKFTLFIRFWVQSYMDLAIVCFIQLSSFSSTEPVAISSIIAAVIAVGFLVGTPVAIVLFFYAQKDQLKSVSEDSETYSKFGTLFYEVNYKHDFKACFTYVFFTLQRLLLAASLILLGSYPYLQACVNCALVFLFGGFVIIVRPYKNKVTQIVSMFVEVGTFLIFAVVTYFLDSNLDHEETVQTVVICSVFAVTCSRVLSMLLDLGLKIYDRFFKKDTTPQISQEVTTMGTKNQQDIFDSPGWILSSEYPIYARPNNQAKVRKSIVLD